MDKGVRGGAVSIKQWDDALLLQRLISNKIPGRSSTGGLPIRPLTVDTYHIDNRFVAIDTSTSFESIIC